MKVSDPANATAPAPEVDTAAADAESSPMELTPEMEEQFLNNALSEFFGQMMARKQISEVQRELKES